MANKTYYVDIGSIRYAWSAPTTLYPTSIASVLGVKTLGNTTPRGTVVLRGKTGKYMPRIRVRTANKKNYLVFCDPANVENALSNLIGKNLRGSRIVGAKVPKRIQYI